MNNIDNLNETETIGLKTIKWIEKPPIINEEEYIEFLKRDIFIKDEPGKIIELPKIVKISSDLTANIYNLDRIAAINNVPNSELYHFCKKIIPMIKDNLYNRVVVHTNTLNETIAELFRNEGIIYLEKNLDDRTTAFQIITKLIKPLFSTNNSISRNFMRIDYSKSNILVELENHKIKIKGKLKDLSLNGVGVVFTKINDLNFFSLKDKVKMNFYINHHLIKIDMALVSRIDGNNLEVGMNFDLNNSSMIQANHSDTISKIIYNHLKKNIINTI